MYFGRESKSRTNIKTCQIRVVSPKLLIELTFRRFKVLLDSRGVESSCGQCRIPVRLWIFRQQRSTCYYSSYGQMLPHPDWGITFEVRRSTSWSCRDRKNWDDQGPREGFRQTVRSFQLFGSVGLHGYGKVFQGFG